MNDAAGNIIDEAGYRRDGSLTRWSYFGPVGSGLGLPALAGVGVGVAMIGTLCMLRVIRLQYRLTTEAGKTP